MRSQKIATKEIELGELISISKGKKLPEINQGCSTIHKRYIQINDLRTGANLKYTNSEAGVEVIQEDLIIAWDGANAGTVGYGLEGFIGSTLARLRPEVKDLYTPFVGRFLQSRFQLIRNNCTGATIPHVSRSFLESIKIPLPPLPEQKRIAAILDKADAIRKKRKQAIELTETFLRSAFLEMFGDPVTNPKGWEMVNIESVARVTDGTHDTPKYVDQGFPLITAKNLVGIELDFSTARFISEDDHKKFSVRSKVDKGDILFGMIGTLGNATIVDTDEEISIKNVGLYKPYEKITSAYLWGVLRDDHYFQDMLSGQLGGNQKFIALGPLRSLQLPLPPLNEQKKFTALLNKMKNLRCKWKEGISRQDHLFNSLVQRAFRGEL